jgi:CMP-N-acetylneuraminic acid synthetase
MVPSERAIDIDTEFDIQMLELIMNQRKEFLIPDGC